MRLGALLSLSDGSNPDGLADQARAFEAEGYSSIWSAHAMGRGFMMADPLIALTAAAVATKKVELGTAIMQIPLYNPTDLALKSYALAQVSGNRFTLGVGAGSTKNDYQIHHADYASRFKLFDNSLQSLREIFATGDAGGLSMKPWPAVKAPSLLFGTWGKNVIRAAEEFDGWIASGMHRSVEQVVAAIETYRSAGGGRAVVSTIQLSSGQDLGELRDRFGHYQEAGFDDAVVMFLPGAPSLADVRKLVD